MSNMPVKIALLEAGMKQCELAAALGIHRGSLSRKLRNELPEDEQEKLLSIIREHTKTTTNEKKKE